MSRTDPFASTGALPPVGIPPPDPRRLWRILLAVIAPLPALGLAAAALTTPYSLEAEADAVLAGAAAHLGLMQITVWLNLLAMSTLIPATIAVAWVCRRRAPRLTTVGALVSLLGFAAGVSLPHDDLTALAAAQHGLDLATAVALNEAVWNQPTTVLALLVFLLGMVIGGVLLGIALWRSRVAPRWMALVLIVSSPLHLAPALASNSLSAFSWALTALGYTAASLALLRMSNDEFDLPPTPTT